ncbi:MAG: DUF58 domain-containing protein [Planctomycetes bacterium]|nr:DUF58 domain-containing protein [Planctomycetota bacterium]
MIGRRRTRLTREGWYYLLVLAFVVTGAMLREINLLMIMAGLLLGPLLLNWRMAVISLRPLRARRRATDMIGAGEMLAIEIMVQSSNAWLPRLSPGGWAVTVDDVIRRVGPGPSNAKLHTGVLFWHIVRGETARLAYRGKLVQRGRYQFGPLTISTCFPLGMVRRTAVMDAPHELIVLPRLGRLTPAWQALCRRALYAERGRRTQQSALEGDFHSLRDWRPGDARRQIHWRTTARRRTPVVRKFERPQNADVAVLLDLCQRLPGEDLAAERAISFVATIVNDLCRQNSGHVVLGTAGRKAEVLRGPASAALLRECMVHLAMLEAGQGSTFESMLADVLSKLRRDTQVVVITTRSRLGEDGAARLTQGWMAAGGRPIVPALVIDAAKGEVNDYFSNDEASVEAHGQDEGSLAESGARS